MNARPNTTPIGIDWPTVALVVFFWSAFAVVVLLHHRLPTVFVVGVLVMLGGLYTSLQHEIIHGHPTPWKRLNWLMVSAPLGLTQPFERYRVTHLDHHLADLTDPIGDPESSYVTARAWERASAPYRMLLRVNRTMAGRLSIGPVLALVRMARSDAHLARTRPDVQRAWLAHLVAVVVVIVALRTLGVPLWVFILGFAFGGASITSLRSFVEHLAVDGAPRSAIVHSGAFFSLIFLNNNLHYTHHQLPGAAWFRLPELTRSLGAEQAAATGAGVYRGYREVARRFMFRPFGQPVHPFSATIDV